MTYESTEDIKKVLEIEPNNPQAKQHLIDLRTKASFNNDKTPSSNVNANGKIENKVEEVDRLADDVVEEEVEELEKKTRIEAEGFQYNFMNLEWKPSNDNEITTALPNFLISPPIVNNTTPSATNYLKSAMEQVKLNNLKSAELNKKKYNRNVDNVNEIFGSPIVNNVMDLLQQEEINAREILKSKIKSKQSIALDKIKKNKKITLSNGILEKEYYKGEKTLSVWETLQQEEKIKFEYVKKITKEKKSKEV